MHLPRARGSMIRLRVSEADAHYGGGLVAGAFVMGIFGDVATELLIRRDGDEGLFVAYDTVEFVAPVNAGDYLEVTGRIVGEGRTSRRMEFEARKVIAPRPDLGPSAAEMLATPVLVARATGTCVVPADKQRLGLSRTRRAKAGPAEAAEAGPGTGPVKAGPAKPGRGRGGRGGRKAGRRTRRPREDNKSETFRKLFDEGKSMAEIAKMTGANYGFVYGVIRRHMAKAGARKAAAEKEPRAEPAEPAGPEPEPKA